MSRIKLPKQFPIILTNDPQQITNLVIGIHQQYVVRANGLEIARFLDPLSSQEYMKFLVESNFKTFRDSVQGMNFLEQIYLLGEKERLKANVVDGKEIQVRSLDQKD